MAAETFAVFAATLGVILLLRHWPGLSGQWWLTPAILIGAGMVPFLARRQSLPAIVRIETLRGDLWTLLLASLVVFPATYLTTWLIAWAGISLPLTSARPSDYAAWIAYQFFYVAVAEEVFFRGYLLTSLQALFGGGAAIVVSAACFAAAHVVLQGQITAALTFLPGLILGWLFVRTGTLLAPMLFHGMANVFWLFLVRCS